MPVRIQIKVHYGISENKRFQTVKIIKRFGCLVIFMCDNLTFN